MPYENGYIRVHAIANVSTTDDEWRGQCHVDNSFAFATSYFMRTFDKNSF